jgi:FO synthase
MLNGEIVSDDDALDLAHRDDLPALMTAAAQVRDAGFQDVVTYSRKVFVPLTQLCRDVCHYCTYAKTPRRLAAPYLQTDEVIALARHARQHGCKEALFTLGEKPELRYRIARDALSSMGFATTLEYLAHVAGRVVADTGLLPHINAGCMTAEEIALLRPVSASMGIMLESVADRLCEKGLPHHGSPDKQPAARLETIRLCGEARVPFTSGILIGIGETRRERVESLLALRALHRRYDHIQEIIIQNFRAKPGTRMAHAPEPAIDDLLWTVAVARLIFGPEMSIQAPPNLNPGQLPQLVRAGINDWGGVSPVTQDHVNPEAPWPHLDVLARQTREAGKTLHERLTIYPRYAAAANLWLDERLRTNVLRQIDAEGFPRVDAWIPGGAEAPPQSEIAALTASVSTRSRELTSIVERASAGERLDERDLVRLFQSRNADFAYVCQAADRLRAAMCGDEVSYVVNRNINYTNVCTYKCRFCAFSKGRTHADLRGPAYDLPVEEIQRRVVEAWQRGATEVCMQGGIHPAYDGNTYVRIVDSVKAAVPGMHVHAFSPLEVSHGARTLGLDVETFLRKLKHAGLGTLPGTAAEILDDEVRAVLCPDKLSTAEWLDVMATAHRIGLRTTATIMFGHVESPVHWARHLLRIRDLQQRTGGFTEFVPLPFVAMEAPIYVKGAARRGPTFRECLLMHAVARLALNPLIPNIQASWVKLGPLGVAACLNAGANDVGGTLMNESITRAAGAIHGEEFAPAQMDQLIRDAGRLAMQRTTGYAAAPRERVAASYCAEPLAPLVSAPLQPLDRRRIRNLRLQTAPP